MTMGKKTPKAMTATLDGSPMPSQRMRRGRMAILGMGNVAAMRGLPTASGMLKKPIRMPTTRPTMHAILKPRRIRLRLARTCLNIKPVFSMLHPSSKIALGAGRKRGGIHSLRLTNSQTMRIMINDVRLSHGCSLTWRK
jgi:hypothetical protein